MDRYDPYKSATDKNVGSKYDELEIVRAISGLTEWQKHVQTDSNIDRDITVAIEALKAQLGTNLAEFGAEERTKTHACDCISRQAAIDALCNVCDKNCNKSEFVYNAPQAEQVILCPEHYALCNLQPAQPEQRTGKWIVPSQVPDMVKGYWVTCSVCKKGVFGGGKFCKECGAKMEGSTE